MSENIKNTFTQKKTKQNRLVNSVKLTEEIENKSLFNEESEKETPIDHIEFTNANNKLTLKMTQKPNGLYKLSIWLNNSIEIKSATYNGPSAASSYWKLIKNILIRDS